MKDKTQAQQNLAKLPPRCFAILPTTKAVIGIEAGMSGYRPLDCPPPLSPGETVEEFVAKTNAEMGVSKGQAEAMFQGSMFGWDTLAANPDIYDKDGTLNHAAFEAALNRTPSESK
jgi:hypothetical protein